jgi:hypothetical protein
LSYLYFTLGLLNILSSRQPGVETARLNKTKPTKGAKRSRELFMAQTHLLY